MLRSRSTPQISALHAIDEFDGLEPLDLSPPLVGLKQVKVPVHKLGAKEGRSDASTVASEETVGAPLDCCKLILRNTFLDLGRLERDEYGEEFFPRKRALSDWSGEQARLAASCGDVTKEELTAPMFGAVYQGGESRWEEGNDLHEDGGNVDLESEGWQWQGEWQGCDGNLDLSQGEGWIENWQQLEDGSWIQVSWQAIVVAVDVDEAQLAEMAAAGQWSEDRQCRAEPPPPPAGKEPFRPKWIYGTTWPFNAAPTTLKLENLPKELTQEQLLATIDRLGFSGSYNFVFMPTEWATWENYGHAIIKLTRHSWGLALAAHLHEFEEWGIADSCSSEKCSVKWSLPMQGLTEHVENYRNDPAMHESVDDRLRPMLFRDGWRLAFPPPTRSLRRHERHRF